MRCSILALILLIALTLAGEVTAAEKQNRYGVAIIIR